MKQTFAVLIALMQITACASTPALTPTGVAAIIFTPTLTPTLAPASTATNTREPIATATEVTKTPTATATAEPKVPSLEALNKRLIFSGPADTHIGRPLVGQWNSDGWDKNFSRGNASVQEMTDPKEGKFVRFIRTGPGIAPSGEIRNQLEEYGPRVEGNIVVAMKFRIGTGNTGGNSNLLTTVADRNPEGTNLYLLTNVNFDKDRNLFVDVYDRVDRTNETYKRYTTDLKLDSNVWYSLELRVFKETGLVNILLDGKPVVFNVENKKKIWLPGYQNEKVVSLVGLHGGYYKYKLTYQNDPNDFIDNAVIEAYTFDYPYPQGD